VNRRREALVVDVSLATAGPVDVDGADRDFRAMRTLLIVAVALCSACAASVNGKIDDENVPALFSAFFVQSQQDGFDPTSGAPATVFSVSGAGMSMFDGCNVSAKRQNAINDAFDQQTKDLRAAQNQDATNAANEKFIDAVVSYDTANMPSDFWLVGIQMSALSANDLASASATIDIVNPDTKATDTAFVQICRVDNWPEKKISKDKVPSLVTHQTCFDAKKGTANVKSWSKDKTLSIAADTSFSRDESTGPNPDDDSGAAGITISAGWCQDLEQALDDEKKLQEDRAGATTP
jgi:hypothetical protein